MHQQASDRDLAVAVEALRSGMNVIVSGLPESGRTHFLECAEERLQKAGVKVISLSGVPMPDPLPLHAFVGGEWDLVSARHNIDVYSLIKELRRRLQTPGSVIIIDNVEDLDSASIRTILAARQENRNAILAATRSQERGQSDALTRYISPAMWIPLAPLRHDEIHRVLNERLGLELEAHSLSLVANISGGLPGLALAVTQALHLRGDLTKAGNSWKATLPLWGADFAGFAEQYLVGMDESMLNALRSIAATKGLTVKAAQATPLWEHIQSLEAAGVVHAMQVDGEDELTVYPPLLGEYLRRDTGAASLQELSGMIGTDHVSHGLSEPLEDIASFSARETTLLSYHYRRHWEENLATLKEAHRHHPTPLSTLQYAENLARVSASASEVDAVLEAPVISTGDANELRLAAWRACFRAVVLGRKTDAMEDLMHGEQAFPTLASGFRAVRAHIELVTTGMPDDALLAPPKTEQDPLSLVIRSEAQAEVLIAQGMPLQALRLLDASSHLEPVGDVGDSTLRGNALFLDGRVDEALYWARRHHKLSRQSVPTRWDEGHAYLVALILALSGRTEEFDRHMSTVVALASPLSINAHLLTATLSFASGFATERGLTEQAVAFATQAASLRLEAGLYPGIPSDIALEFTQEDGYEKMWREAEQRLKDNYISTGVMLGSFVLAARPNSERATLLVSSAKKSESVLLQQLAAYAQAASTEDVPALLRISREFARLGLLFYAVQSGVAAACVLVRQGQSSEASSQVDAVWRLIKSRGNGLEPLLRRFVDATGLTDREIEVVLRLPDGVSYQQLADELFVSVRTIEQHILRAKNKLGYRDRDALIRAAQTWLSPFAAD